MRHRCKRRLAEIGLKVHTTDRQTTDNKAILATNMLRVTRVKLTYRWCRGVDQADLAKDLRITRRQVDRALREEILPLISWPIVTSQDLSRQDNARRGMR